MNTLTQDLRIGDLWIRKNPFLYINYLYSKEDYEPIFAQASYLEVLFHKVEISWVNFDI